MQKKLVIVLIVVIVALSGVLIWQNLGSKAPVENNTPIVSNPPQENEQVNSDETADWKTYTDENSGFSMNYPGNWIVESNGTGVMIKNLPVVDVVGNSGPKTKEGSIFEVRTFDMPKAQTIQEQINSYNFSQDLKIDQNLKQERLSQVVTKNIAGENRDVWPGSGLSNWQDVFEFTSGKIDYQITYMSGSPEQFQKDMPTFQKMLNSFQLTQLTQ